MLEQEPRTLEQELQSLETAPRTLETERPLLAVQSSAQGWPYPGLPFQRLGPGLNMKQR